MQRAWSTKFGGFLEYIYTSTVLALLTSRFTSSVQIIFINLLLEMPSASPMPEKMSSFSDWRFYSTSAKRRSSKTARHSSSRDDLRHTSDHNHVDCIVHPYSDPTREELSQIGTSLSEHPSNNLFIPSSTLNTHVDAVDIKHMLISTAHAQSSRIQKDC